ncbi:sodium/hydrogen exchanger 10 [Lingula anatina]|uniref:Sodium/hydrogen exchanger 10 n=1 Tax=Lingula anatina TaxID=7574 RepID=A0A1S3KDK7_LINAN|nr:sodium/hydrogen exchanger 10 [Lingula anatina]|eukprot:XP_013420708.1 sodium/hydrogen exchanger 10 [Lingula anatina]
MDPHLLLHIFLPVLVFESAFAMEAHTFIKSFMQIVVLAIPGLLLASVLTGLLAMYVFQYNWELADSMMFGSILSATDPVAVVALLREVGASKQLGTLIEGESLLNDGAAIVLFNVLRKISKSAGQSVDGGEIVLNFIQIVFGGTLFGFVMAKLTTLWLSEIFNDALTEITITLACTYMTYFIGENFFGVSGVLAIVVVGVILNAERTSISPEVEAFLHRFWEMMAYLANTLIFILVGVVITERSLSHAVGKDWFYMIALYFGIIVIRALVICLFSPVLKRIGYGMNWKNGAVMTWGGLRGAVGLALGLLVAQDPELNPDAPINIKGNKMLLHVSGIVILTLLINATTISTLLKILGMSDISTAKRMTMANAVRHLKETKGRTLNVLKADRFLADADWDMVEESCEISDPYHTTEEEAELDSLVYYNRTTTCPDCETAVPAEPSPQEYKEMVNEARLRMLRAEKVSYWKQFEHGMLSREAVRKLVDQTEHAADHEGGFVDVEEIKKSWQIKGIYPLLKRKLESWILDTKIQSVPPPKRPLLRKIYKMVNSVAFESIVYTVIFLNMIPIIVETSWDISNEEHHKVMFDIINYIFFSLYIIEAGLKILSYGKYYFASHWNKFDLVIIALSVVDIAIDLTVDLGSAAEAFNPNLLKIPKIFRLLRMSRLLRLFKPLIPKIIAFLNRQINQMLSYGYDVGKGYVVGEEEVKKLIDHINDNKKIAVILKQVSDKGRLEVIRELGLLQREHPGIAVSVKTRQAIRSVLNTLRDSILELRGDGLLDEMEGQKLEMMVEERMKKLLKAPSSIPPPSPIHLLRNVAWLKGDDRLLEFFVERAELLTYNYGDTLMRRGDLPNGIYILLSGMVKLQGVNEDKTEGGISHDEEVMDYLSAGNVLGEMGFLTNSPRNADIICETSVQVYLIKLEDMLLALHTFVEEPSLEYRLWHVCAVRLSTTIMLNQPQYQGWTKEKMQMYLESSFLVSTEDLNVFDTTQYDSVMLIQGTATDFISREEYQGPCFIPRNCTKLKFAPNDYPNHIILVVPKEDIPALLPPDRGSKASVKPKYSHYKSSFCLRHASQHRIDLQTRISKTKASENASKTSLTARIWTRLSSTDNTLSPHMALPPIV